MKLLDPAVIEAEIAASVERSADGIARASLFNLVLVDHVRQPSGLSTAVDHLLGRRPARIIHVQRGYDGPTEAQVSARCYPDRRNQGVCFQEVHILNGSDDHGLDPGSWGALLIRDIPVFGLLADPTRPLPDQAAMLRDVADKLVFDGAVSAHGTPWMTLAALAELAGVVRASDWPQATEPRPALADLSWLRLLPIRRAIARAFDTEAAAGAWLGIRAIDVRGGAPVEAALVTLWLASRLGWRLTAALPSEASFEDPRGIAVRFTHAAGPGGAPGALALAIVLDGGESIEIERVHDMLVTRGQDGTISQTPARPPSDGALLLQEVDTVRGDSLFYAAIAAAAAATAAP
jgi:hypothetical protein